MSSEVFFEVKGLSRAFGGVQAVDQVEFELRQNHPGQPDNRLCASR
jgi:ABC-type branched-subunit amino acid transport system ATPase component